MFRRLSVLVALPLLGLLAPTAHAADAVLALSWEPEFCYSHASKPECEVSPDGYYAASNLVLHGLWPNGNSYCGVSATNVQYDQNSQWSKLPAVRLSSASRNQLNELMPGTLSYLERHEWIKHGTCSGLSQQNYFNVLIRLAQNFGTTRINQLIGDHVGGSVARSDLQAAIDADFGANASQAVAFNCDGNYLTEIQVLLDTSVYSNALSGSQMHYNSNHGNCPTTIRISSYQ